MQPEVLDRLRNLFPIHEAFYIHDVMIECRFSAEATLSTTENLYLAILGLPGCGDHTYPLTRISEMQWVYTGLIEIYFGSSQTESVIVAITSDSLGDIGGFVFPRANLSRHRIIQSIEGTTAKVQGVISFTLLPFQPPKDMIPEDEHTKILAEKMVDINKPGGYTSPIAYQEALETLQDASRTWTGHSIRKVALDLAESLLPKQSDGLGVMESAVDTHLSLLEITIGLSINPFHEVKEDAIALGNSVTNYAQLLHHRYTFHKDIEDIDRSIVVQKLSLMLPQYDSLVTPEYAIITLLQFLHKRSASTSRARLAEFDEAVDAARAAFNVDEENPTRIRSRCLVVSALIGRFEESGQAGDLEDGKTLLEEVMDFVTSDETLYGEMLGLYARVLGLLSGDDVVRINTALASCHKALQYSKDPADSQRQANIHDTVFSLMHQLQSSDTNSRAKTAEDAMGALAIATSHRNRIKLGPDSFIAFAQLRLQHDTLTASQVREQITLTRLEISNLSFSARLDLKEAAWEHLAELYHLLSQITGHRSYLDCAINASRMAKTVRSEWRDADGGESLKAIFKRRDELRHGSQRAQLGRLLAARYQLTNDPVDIQEAVSIMRKCLESLSSGNRNFSNTAVLLGLALLLQGGQSIEEGLSVLSDAASLSTAPHRDRLIAAQLLMLKICMIYGPKHSIEAGDMFMELFVTISNTKKSAGGRYEFLSKYSGEVLRAVMCTIQAERLDKALEWMEQGRGLVWSQLRNLRCPLDDLHTANPELAKCLETVSQQLEDVEGHVSRSTQRPGITAVGQEQTVALHYDAARYFQLSKEREQILETIQNKVPGFGNFLRPKPCSVLMENLPDSGPVIVINVHKDRCDALVLMRGHNEPLHIPLPDFSFQCAQELQERLRHTLDKRQLRTRGDDIGDPARSIRPCPVPLKVNPHYLPPIELVLRELWMRLVKTILDALALFPSSDTPTTRVWWCPTGPLTFLPIHAAGIYRGDSAIALSDFAISSYIPTVAVLSEKIANPRNTPLERSGILLVSVPEGKGSSVLIPGTTLEVDKVHSILTSYSIPTLHLHGRNATVSDGLSQMKKRSCIHLACHAKQDASQPLESGFLFHDDRLDLSTIIKCNLKYADFAFLSACQTSTGHETLSEEAVHLAAGMLAAGYRGVVATMWSIPDRYAPQVAESFYTDLLARGSHTPGTEKSVNGANAAYSIHQAVKNLRTEIGFSEAAMLAWVPYVHFGL